MPSDSIKSLAGMPRDRPLDPPPIFLLGHWRSGTTHLYNLLGQGDFAYVDPIAAGLPWEFLTLGRWLRPLLALVFGTVLAAGTVVAARTEVTSLRYSLANLRTREAELRERVERLQVDSAALRAPEQIRSRARALGLGPPGPGQVVRLPLPEVAAGGSR